MKRGPTKVTMERLLAERPAAELVTDWIPCTTPPVRGGDYDFRLRAGQIMFNGEPQRGEVRDGKWFSILDGGELYAINGEHQHAYEWRGVRRWVLVMPGGAYLHSARPKMAKIGDLFLARPFLTEAKAQRFADRYSRLGLTAVLP